MQIRVTTNFPQEPIIRQTPGRSGNWKDCHFTVNEPGSDCDYWVVMDGLMRPETKAPASGKVILLTLEPPGIRTYCTPYLGQYDLVISCIPNLNHPNVRRTYQGLVWHSGVKRSASGSHSEKDASYQAIMDYDSYSAMPLPAKEKTLSVICSNANFLPGHRRRLAFVEELKKAFGDSIDVFGRGIRPVADKLDAILPYKYHIALENSFTPDYWSEKLADSYLGFAHPFYSGCPNIDDYFDPRSMTKIDVAQPARAVEIIRQAIADDVYQRNFDHLLNARRLVLEDYNTFEVIRKACLSLQPGQKRVVTLKPNESFFAWKVWRFLVEVKRIVKGRR